MYTEAAQTKKLWHLFHHDINPPLLAILHVLSLSPTASSTTIKSDNIMGIVFGVLSYVEQATFEPVPSDAKDYELRKYAACVAAHCNGVKRNYNSPSAFRTLANYIGVFGGPLNTCTKGQEVSWQSWSPNITMAPTFSKPTPVAMTTPVIIRGGDTENTLSMDLILPKTFTDVGTAPVPACSQITIHERPKKIVASVSFSGRPTFEEARVVASKLLVNLKRDGIQPKMRGQIGKVKMCSSFSFSFFSFSFSFISCSKYLPFSLFSLFIFLFNSLSLSFTFFLCSFFALSLTRSLLVY